MTSVVKFLNTEGEGGERIVLKNKQKNIGKNFKTKKRDLKFHQVE